MTFVRTYLSVGVVPRVWLTLPPQTFGTGFQSSRESTQNLKQVCLRIDFVFFYLLDDIVLPFLPVR
jgi:hypothetical protein